MGCASITSNTEKNPMNLNTKLSLKLSPEAAKVLPWLINAKKGGKPKDVDWAKREFELAKKRAHYREMEEREAEERRARRAFEQRLFEERCEREYYEWEHEQEEQQALLERLGTHFAVEDGWEEIQPTQSSQKGWRRLLSEYREVRDWGFCGDWSLRPYGHRSRRNCGRKPRKPWFK